MDQDNIDTTSLNVTNPINSSSSPPIGQPEPEQQEEVVRYPIIISHHHNHNRLQQEGSKRKLVLRTLQHIIFQSIRTIMNAVVTIFSMGLGVGLILGDTLHGSGSSNATTTMASQGQGQGQSQSNGDSNDSMDDALIANRVEMVAAAGASSTNAYANMLPAQ